MDANGTRLFMLFGERDWAACADENGIPFSDIMNTGPEEYFESTVGIGWDEARSEVTLHPRLMKFKAAPRDIEPRIDDRRGSACDSYGNKYWIDSSENEVMVNSAGTGVTSHFWSPADQQTLTQNSVSGEFHPKESQPVPLPCRFQGLAVTEDHYLIVGVLDPAGLLVFDLHSGGPPRQVLWPEPIAFEPFDMAPAPGGGAWILDRSNKRYWRLDRNLSVVNYGQTEEELTPSEADFFHAQEGSADRPEPGLFPTGIPLSIPSPLEVSDPISIEGLPDGTVLILDTDSSLGSSTVCRYKFGQQLGRPVLLDEFEFAGHDLAFVPEHQSDDGTISDRLYIASTEGNQAYAFGITLDDDGNLVLELLNEYYPMRLFGGKAVITSGASVYYDFGTGWVPLIRQLRPRYTVQGTLETPVGDGRPPFDGRVPDCVWHRLMMDACIPAGTEIAVESRAANDPGLLASANWLTEPGLHLRGDGSELPFAPRDARNDSGTWELLFQRAVGRYLQVRLTLMGTGRDTPRLRCLRIYAPRFSYLKEYLPAVYREDETSASFLDRFLANFEGTFTAIEDRIAAVQMLFDPVSIPQEALDWLAGWLGVLLDPGWDEYRRRIFIRHAMTFFNLRGTIRGLKLALRLALDDCIDESVFEETTSQCTSSCGIRIVEKFRTRWLSGVMAGDATESTGLRAVIETRRWQPAQGRDLLQQMYRQEFGLPENKSFPLIAKNADSSVDWEGFVRDTLGFVPTEAAGDNELWQEFLARRYKQPSIMNDTYHLAKGKGKGSFADVVLPETLPADGAPLLDWYEFQTIILAAHRLAHRFTVLVPLSPSESGDSQSQRDKLELARRIIDLEKPAHTVFDVKFYWDLFRVGMVRLGIDTVLDAGSGARYFISPAILGQSYLLESYLAPGHPQNISDRTVLGRDSLAT